MQRRWFLGLISVASTGHAGCLSEPSRPMSPSRETAAQVTTSSTAGLEFRISQVAIPADAEGPDAYYRVRNPTRMEAVIRLETRPTIEGGATHTAVAVVTVPAGDEVTVSYQIVSFAILEDEEERQVRNADVTFTVLINGQERYDI